MTIENIHYCYEKLNRLAISILIDNLRIHTILVLARLDPECAASL